MRRRKYVRQMMKALRLAQTDWLTKGRHSKTDALRVIKRFEEVNGIAFDPCNDSHLRMITSRASHEHFLGGRNCFLRNAVRSNEDSESFPKKDKRNSG